MTNLLNLTHTTLSKVAASTGVVHHRRGSRKVLGQPFGERNPSLLAAIGLLLRTLPYLLVRFALLLAFAIGTCALKGGGGREIQEVVSAGRFPALRRHDSPVEGEGFEPSVPLAEVSVSPAVREVAEMSTGAVSKKPCPSDGGPRVRIHLPPRAIPSEPRRRGARSVGARWSLISSALRRC
jgi:hypothetical protein